MLTFVVVWYISLYNKAAGGQFEIFARDKAHCEEKIKEFKSSVSGAYCIKKSGD